MSKTVTSGRRRDYLRVVRSVAAWATQQPDVVGVAVVGSWARGQARMDSDVDLVVLTNDKDRYITDGRWVPDAVGESAELVRTQEWGPLTERRVVLRSGLEVEFGFVPPSWASVDPADPGTACVVRDGCSPLVDPKGAFARLSAAVGGT
ncbi:MAG TPA: nucleotidyltransferase domain-containing protein [Acidimicrobiales bacterium]